MARRILPEPPEGSELARWVAEGTHHAPSHSNIAYFVSPEEAYTLTVEVDDPVHGFHIQLSATARDDDEPPIGRTIVDDRELALEVATHMAAAADDLDALADRPQLGPERIHREDVLDDTAEPPDEFDGDDQEWRDALEDAFEAAEIPRAKGTLTTKEIDGRQYYYLQWREGDSIKSQYVAPVSPSG